MATTSVVVEPCGVETVSSTSLRVKARKVPGEMRFEFAECTTTGALFGLSWSHVAADVIRLWGDNDDYLYVTLNGLVPETYYQVRCTVVNGTQSTVSEPTEPMLTLSTAKDAETKDMRQAAVTLANERARFEKQERMVATVVEKLKKVKVAQEEMQAQADRDRETIEALQAENAALRQQLESVLSSGVGGSAGTAPVAAVSTPTAPEAPVGTVPPPAPAADAPPAPEEGFAAPVAGLAHP